ncbi:hypothetical protein [Halobacteriovorax sp.]|uniref:hypothetical protein n=1 Tax=Halobacteriovorax sp. TaxID=2020862 RepID=UPI00356223E3
MIKEWIKIYFILVISLSSYGFNTTPEIERLNKEFNQGQEYPILIFDKDIIRNKLTDSKPKNLKIIKDYILEKFNIKLEKFDSETILDYHTVLNNSASALPFKDSRTNKYRFCAVFPSGANLEHKDEVKRILGITDNINPYPEQTVEKVMKLMTLKELKLISLYHELSHCLDKTYIPILSMPNSHNIHMAESFAESMSLLFVTKRFKFKNIALRRSVLRGLYTKYMGKHIINDEDTIVMHPSAKEMGVVYYLSPTLLSINSVLSSYKFRINNYSTKELGEMALKNTTNYAFDSRTFAAIVNYLKNGEQESISEYLRLTESAPDLFYSTYLRMRKEILFINDLDFLLENISN